MAYWSGHLISAVMAFVMIPVFTRYLRPDALGTVTMFGLLTTFLDAVIGFGVSSAPSRRAFDLERPALASYMGTVMMIIITTGLGVGALAAVLSSPLRALTLLEPGWILLAVAVAVSNNAVAATLGVLQAMGRAWAYVAIQVGRVVVAFGLSVCLVVHLEFGWAGRVAGIAGGSLLALPVALLLLHATHLIRWVWRRDHAQHAFSYGLPLVPHIIGGTFMALTDRYFVAQHCDLSSVGVYSIGYQLGFGIAMLQDGFNKAWVPWLFSRLKRADELPGLNTRLVALTYLYYAGILTLAFSIAAVAPFLLGVLVPADYQGASEIVLWIALAYAFDGMYKMVANYVFWAERTSLLGTITFLAAMVNFPLAWVMTRWNGAIGAAQAATIIFAAMWLATWLLSSRCHPMPWWEVAVSPLRRLRAGRRRIGPGA